MTRSLRSFRMVLLLIALACGAVGISVYAQLEGNDRGVPPIDSASNFEVGGISVDVVARTADMARTRGWREAQRLGWKKLWEQTHGTPAPNLSDGELDSMVSGIVVEDEQIGPNRYIARLGVLFDRVRTGSVLGVAGQGRRSAPLLVIPVQISGGVAQSFETRTEWQKAWARFRTADSVIDYVRPTGNGADPLLLTNAQTMRPGRRWWRMLLDQYGAADVLVPQVRLQRVYPGGPIIGTFSAFFGPDKKPLGAVTLRVSSATDLPKLLDAGVKQLDGLYAAALARGALRPDTSLVIEQPIEDAALDEAADAAEADTGAEGTPPPAGAAAIAPSRSLLIQFDSPDVASVPATEAAVRSIAGVRAANTTSLALGGVSVMRVAFDGDAEALRLALAGRGYRVSVSGDTLRIRR